MLGRRSLLLALSLIVAAPAIAAPPRPRPATATKSEARKRPTARRNRPAQPAKKVRQARMSEPVIRRPLLEGAGAVPAGTNTAPAGASDLERQLQSRLDGILGSKWLKSTINGVYVVDAVTGQVLYAYGADRQLNPASNTKLVTTATALELLGGEYTYVTRLVGAAPDAEGTVPGDVILLGSADPTLRVDHLGDLTARLQERGVKKIAGDIVVGSDPRDGVAHAWVRVTVRGSDQDGELPAVRLAPDSGYFVVANHATTGAVVKAKGKKRRGGLEVDVQAVEGEHGPQVRVTVSGRVSPGQEVEIYRDVPRPVLYTAHTLRGSLLLAGIEVGGVRQESGRPEAPIDSLELARHDSVPLRELAALINKPSNNYLADHLLLTVGAEKFGGDASMDKGVRAMREWLESIGVDDDTVRFENGSGLSHSIHISARQIAQVLLAGMKDERIGREWIDSFSVAGEDGTLRYRFAGHPSAGFIRGKTGTLSGVSALSGFVTLRDDANVCFSILTTGYRDRRKQVVRESQAEIADAIYDYLRARLGDAAPTQPPADLDL